MCCHNSLFAVKSRAGHSHISASVLDPLTLKKWIININYYNVTCCGVSKVLSTVHCRFKWIGAWM